jgi:hemerythrin
MSENVHQPDSAAQSALPPAELFGWKPNYSVGIGIIDQHHQRLFSLVNSLHNAMVQQQGKIVLASTLTELFSYTQLHFTSEEVLMEAFGYPELLIHRIEHDRLLRTVQAFQDEFFRGQAQLTVQLMDFLKTWLQKHILGSDQRYVQFFAGRGAKP